MNEIYIMAISFDELYPNIVWWAQECELAKLESLALCIALTSSAWNQAVGLPHNHLQILQIIKEVQTNDPNVWEDMRSTDWREIHNVMISYKLQHYPDDYRKIIKYGYLDGKVHVEYIN
jgi:hypothetical protein